MTTWRQWLNRATNRDSDREIARRTRLAHTTIGRWRNTGTAPADGVIVIARAYGADPIDGLVSAGLLTQADLSVGMRNAVRQAPTAYLTEELHDRVTTGRAHDDFDELRRMIRARA